MIHICARGSLALLTCADTGKAWESTIFFNITAYWLQKIWTNTELARLLLSSYGNAGSWSKPASAPHHAAAPASAPHPYWAAHQPPTTTGYLPIFAKWPAVSHACLRNGWTVSLCRVWQLRHFPEPSGEALTKQLEWLLSCTFPNFSRLTVLDHFSLSSTIISSGGYLGSHPKVYY